MTKQQIAMCIFKVLSETMAHPHLKYFNSDANFINDLALDSSLLLQLLMHLDVEYNLSVSEEALLNEDFETVRHVVNSIYSAQNLPSIEKGLEVYEDLKVHCVASNLSEIVKRQPGLDHRIIYFSVWDAEVCIDDNFILTYHSDTIDHSRFIDSYEYLYGMKIRSWYQHEKTKEDNIDTLISLVENKTEDQHIMVMLDMYHLPNRDNEFNKDPFPHYLMLGPTNNPDEWMVYDPDYRWEGISTKDEIINAVNKPTVSGGYIFSDKKASPTTPEAVKKYFESGFSVGSNPVTDAVRAVIQAHLDGFNKLGDELPLNHLAKAVEELPVLAPRKYAYEHGFAFFWRELLLPESEFDHWCDVIDELAKTYKLIQFHAMKMSLTKNREIAKNIFDLLDQQDVREFDLKNQLYAVYLIWCEKNIHLYQSHNEAQSTL